SKVEVAGGNPPRPSNQYKILGKMVGTFEQIDSAKIVERKCEIRWIRHPGDDGTKVSGQFVAKSEEDGMLRVGVSEGGFTPPAGTTLKMEAAGETVWFRVASLGRKIAGKQSPAESGQVLEGRAFRVLKKAVSMSPPDDFFLEKL